MRAAFFSLVAGLFIASTAALSFAQVRDSSNDGAPSSYRIQAGDKLSIKFFSNPEFDEPAIIVRPDGCISPQLIPEVRALGKTVAELKSELENAYNEILLTPMITVSIIDFVAPRVFVGGQVSKPGRYDLREARTVAQAVFLAGGFTKDAHREMVVLARPKGKSDWTYQAVNVLKLMDPKGAIKDVDLEDGDYVFVPDSKLSQFNKAVEAFRSVMPGRLFGITGL